jgi:hypothetical protein
VFANALRQHLAPLGQQQFGIAQSAYTVRRIKDHRRSYNAAEQRSASDFVHAGHQART